ncbi:hypothetical protein HBI59_094790 [Parastagonospora nodorum]|nr:hypothetical protein HBI59_094790 [Parastagonospora nodorum]
MTLLRQTQERSSRDSICNAMTLTSDEYETLYAEVKREIRERAILCQSLRTTTRRKMQCNYNPKTGLRNNNEYAEAVVYSAGQSNTVNNAPQLSTILVAKYKDISSLNYTQFIQTLKREVGFEDKRSSIYYYTKTADSWTRIQISTEARWHSALQDTVVTKLYRATFVIKLLI